MLYALSVGFAGSPQDARELQYVYQQPLLKIVPTFATMLSGEVFPSGYRGWDGQKARLAEQKLELYRPLPASGGLMASQRVVDVEEARDGRPARIVVNSEVRLAGDDTALFSLGSTLLSASGSCEPEKSIGVLVRHSLPERDPDLSCDLGTRAEQSLLFALNGDHNPVYADAEAARESGYGRPPLPARCVSGIACRAILRTICDYDYTLINGFEARFAAPVYPGDTITTDMWQDRNIVSFRCSVRPRGVVVIDSGRCTLAG